ncbi:MAG TPA: DUF4143 domain-containing protein, partial [Victivallales bacterium]|nr:DUF4143 domain-containing protein [Victivallales bacterium]
FSIPELLRLRYEITTGSDHLLGLLSSKNPASYLDDIFTFDSGLSQEASESEMAWNYFLHWGGMPRIADKTWTDDDRFEWLCDYQNTYLQRDLADLARLDRLEPFVRAQKAAAMRTARFINHAEIARLSEISSPTAKEFLRYLEISYQVIQIPAWFRNTEKRLAKQSKLHFLDPGIRRAIIRSRGEPDGFEFESAVVAEIFKRVRSARLPLELFHLRTSDGREIDLLIEREDGFIAIECKQTQNPQAIDARHFRNLSELLDKPLLLALIICSGKKIRKFNLDAGLSSTAIPAHLLLS